MPHFSTKKKSVALLFPPVWNANAPFLSIPILTAFLRKHKIEVIPQDLNLKWRSKLLDLTYIKSIQDEMSLLLAQKGMPEEQIVKMTRTRAVLPFVIKHIDKAKYAMKGIFRFTGVVPAQPAKVQDAINTMFFPTIATEIRYISSYGYHSLKNIFDGSRSVSDNIFRSYFLDNVRELLAKNSVFLIGISLTGLSQLVPAFTLAHVIRQLDRTIPIVIGGALLPYMRKALFQTPECFNFADYYVMGEGESALLGLCKYFQNGGNIESVPNLIYKEKMTNRINLTYQHVEDIKKLPFPDYKGLDMSLFGKEGVFAVKTSRGCYWDRCTFCSLCTNTFNKYRERDIEIVIDHMEQLARDFNCQYIRFSDQCFTVARLTELVKLLQKRGLSDKFRYDIQCRFEPGFDTNLLERAYAVGLRAISWGLESAHPDTLRFMRKGIKIETADKCLKDSHMLGIWNQVNVLLDFPGAPADDAQTTLDFIMRNKEFIDVVVYGMFSLDYGSHVYKHPQEYDITIIPQPSDSLRYGADYYDHNIHQYLQYHDWPDEYRSTSIQLVDDALEGTHLMPRSRARQLVFLTLGPHNFFDNGLPSKLAFRSKFLSEIKKQAQIAKLFDQAELPDICVRVPNHIQVNFVIDKPDGYPKEALIFDEKTFTISFVNMVTLQIMVDAMDEISLSELVDKLVSKTNSSQRSYIEVSIRETCKQLAMGGFLIAKSVVGLQTA